MLIAVDGMLRKSFKAKAFFYWADPRRDYAYIDSNGRCVEHDNPEERPLLFTKS